MPVLINSRKVLANRSMSNKRMDRLPKMRVTDGHSILPAPHNHRRSRKNSPARLFSLGRHNAKPSGRITHITCTKRASQVYARDATCLELILDKLLCGKPKCPRQFTGEKELVKLTAPFQLFIGI